jgi:hypothetical protein
MGQAVSKRIGKAAETIVKKAADRKPPLPPTTTTTTTTAATTTTITTKAPNPALFSRGEGEGMSIQDNNDAGQEMFLQRLHKVDPTKKPEGPPDMPDDLLKFIQDVGPTKQSVDKELTTPRLLKEENLGELNKAESTRKPMRERTNMPLMGEDEEHTTMRNTNFRSSSKLQEEKDFGITNMQFYEILTKKDANVETVGTAVDSFYKRLVPEENDWTDQEIEQHRQRLRDAMNAVELPVLRKDANGNFLGLYPADVPGPEVKAVEPIPSNKVKLVLEDIFDKDQMGDTIAAERLERRRQLRKENKA